MGRLQVVVSFLVLTLCVGNSSAKTPTFVCKEPGGKRLIQVDDNQVGPVDGKTELTVDADGTINNRDGHRVLIVSDDDVRTTPTGVKLATFDGENLRHGKGGDIVLNYHEKEICPDPQSNRIYSIEGQDSLSKPQLIAAMYLLKPELFKLTEAEEAEQTKAMADAAAEQDKLDHADQAIGNYMVLNSSGIMENLGQGAIVVADKKGDAYPVSLDLTKGGGPKWDGVGMYQVIGGDKTFWVAYGTPKTVGMCVYEISGGTLKGTWYPWYIDGTPKMLGTESLTGPATLDGSFKINSAKAPATAASYSGTVSIHPLEITGAPDSAKPYSLVWTIGGAKIKGIGIRTGNTLIVASGAGADTMIAKYIIDNGSMNADWYKIGSTEKGSAAATHMN